MTDTPPKSTGSSQGDTIACNTWPSNWLEAVGVWKKRREIEALGLPDPIECKMITLTMAKNGRSPRECYEVGREHMRRFLAKLRRILQVDELGYAWKLEIGDDEYPHWHLVIHYLDKISKDQLRSIIAAWAFGLLHVRAMNRKGYDYIFKVAVPLDSDGEWPAWLLDYRVENGTREKPSASIRIWQTRNFYTGERPEAPKSNEPPKYSRIPQTMRQRIELWKRSMTLTWLNAKGIKKMVSFTLCIPFAAVAHTLLINRALVIRGIARETPKFTPNELKPYIHPWIMKKLTRTMQINSLETVTVSF